MSRASPFPLPPQPVRNRWLFLFVLALGLAGFGVVWYSSLRDTGSGEPEFGGSYREGMLGVPGEVNPLLAGRNAVDQSLVSLIFAGLTRLDDQGRPFPDLAETWSVSDDGLVYTFTLRNGLVWPDAVPLTTDDVIFTYDLWRNAATKASPAPPEAFSSAKVSKVDARAIQVELTQPFSPLPAYLTTGILPQHLLRDATPANLADLPFNQRPMGAGAFRLIELTADHAVLEPNSVYHAGRPFIELFEMRFYHDSQALMDALEALQLDGAYFTSGLAEADVVKLEQDPAMQQLELNTGETTFVYLNLNDTLFQDRRVRQALLYALDRDRIAGLVYGGMARRADSPILAGIWSEGDSLRRYGTDTRAAAQLLDEAGWRLNAAGIRERTGETLSFDLTTTPEATQQAVANEIAAQWKAVGVSVTVQVKGSTAIVRDVLGPRAFDALVFAQPPAPDPDPYAYWHSSQATSTGFNLSSLKNQQIDQLLANARRAQQNPQREQLYAQFQELFAQEVPSIPLYASTALYAQRGVKEAHPGLTTQPGDRFWQVQHWHIKVK